MILPAVYEYLTIEFILNKDEADINALHPYLDKRICMRDPATRQIISVDPQTVADCIARLKEQGYIETDENKYKSSLDKRQLLTTLYDKLGKEWEDSITPKEVYVKT